MIESLCLENFQPHRKRLVEFERFSSFVGETDAGKSSAIRGLLWVLFNQPRGDTFISHGEDWVRSTVRVDGHTVVRHRGKGENYYELDGSRYEAFGTGVPSDIEHLLRISPISVQSQLDPPFWFLLSPGEVSRELNAVVNLDLIDKVLSKAVSSHKKTKLTLQVSTDRLHAARERVRSLGWVLPLSDRIDALGGLERDLVRFKQEVDTLKEVLERLEELEGAEEKVEALAKALGEVVSMGEEIKQEEGVTKILKAVLDGLRENEERLKQMERRRDDLLQRMREEANGKCPMCGSEVDMGILE